MESQKKRFSIAQGSLLLLLALSSCSGSGTSGSASTPISIRYIDDSAAATLIGHSYIAKGKGAPLPIHYDDATWDWTSRSDALPQGKGGYWVFKNFAGTYSDGTAVDLTNVVADCTVKAVFVEKQYHWTFALYNGGKKQGSDQILAFDERTLPTLPSALTDPNPLWYNTSTFAGFTFAKDGGNTVFASGSSFTFQSGNGDPSANAAKGTFYSSLALTNHNRTYPLWISTGSSWVSLGSLKEGLTIRLDAAYTQELKHFTMSFYPTNADYLAKSNLRSETLSFVYGSTLSIDTSNPLLSVFQVKAAGTGALTTLSLTNASSVTNWKGDYTGAEGLAASADAHLNSGEILKDGATLFENCVFYPAA
jgi:hypothetical protein